MNPTNVGTIQYNAVINTAQLSTSAAQANAIVQNTGNQAQSGLGDKFSKAAGIATAALAGLSVAAAGAAAAAGKVGFGYNSAIEQAQVKLEAFTGSQAEAARILSYVKDEAAKTQFSFSEMANSAANLVPAARSSGQSLEKLVQTAEILAATNPAEGLEGAAFALREALSGDFVSVVERFNIPRQRLQELRDQGLPAIDAIRTALAEMGISYDYVAKQGETTAARFDQVKDKATQMAGELTKPIFDRISDQLATLPQKMDNAKLGFEGLMAGFTGGQPATDAISQKFATTGEQLRKMWDAVANFLKPAWDNLVKTYNEELAPAIDRLKPYFDDIAKIVGVVIVAAVWLFINVLAALISRVAEVINAVVDFGQGVSNAIKGIIDWFQRMWQNAVDLKNNIVNTFNSIKSGITSAFSGIASAISSPFKSAFESIRNFWNSTIGGKGLSIPSWVPGVGGKSFTIPRFADGGIVMPRPGGTLGVIGEAGQPEAVIPLNKLDAMLNGSGGGPTITNNIDTININKDADADRFMRELTRNDELVASGITPVTGYA